MHEKLGTLGKKINKFIQAIENSILSKQGKLKTRNQKQATRT
jgi:hypothetical protein